MLVQNISRLNKYQEKYNISKTRYVNTCSTNINSQNLTDYVTFTSQQCVVKASKFTKASLDKAIKLCNGGAVLKALTKDKRNIVFKKDELYEHIYELSINKKISRKIGNYLQTFSKYTYNSETGEINLLSASGYHKVNKSEPNLRKTNLWNMMVKKYLEVVLEKYLTDQKLNITQA